MQAVLQILYINYIVNRLVNPFIEYLMPTVSDCYRVVVQVYMGSHEHLCPVDLLEDGTTIGTVSIQRRTSWPELWRILSHLLTYHLHMVCGSWELQEGLRGAEILLGISSDSVASVKIGELQKPSEITTCDFMFPLLLIFTITDLPVSFQLFYCTVSLIQN